MVKSFVAVIAPGHKGYDERVRRTVDEFAKHSNVLYIYELDLTSPQIEVCDSGFEITHIQFPERGGIGLRARFKKIKDLKALLLGYQIDCFYIHESGTFGLNIIGTLPTNKKIVFDYHDWIPFEIHEKFKNQIIGRLIYFMVKKYIRFITKRIDAVVFISDSAREYFEYEYLPVRSFVVPNSRDPGFLCSDHDKKPLEPIKKNKIELLWLGNVMRLRQIERLFDIGQQILSLRPDIELKISIWGSEKDKLYVNELIALADSVGLAGNLVFNGSIVPEKQILLDTSSLCFGIAYGWDDLYDTQMNLIARPTKFLSYGLLGIVGLLESKCISFHEELKRSGLALSFSSDKHASLEILRLFDNQDEYQNEANRFQEFCVNQSRQSTAGVKAVAKFLSS